MNDDRKNRLSLDRPAFYESPGFLAKSDNKFVEAIVDDGNRYDALRWRNKQRIGLMISAMMFFGLWVLGLFVGDADLADVGYVSAGVVCFALSLKADVEFKLLTAVDRLSWQVPSADR